METSLQVAAGVALLTGTAVMAHFFYVVLQTPEKMNLGLLTPQLPKSWGRRTYLALVILSWMAFAYSGSYGLLKWLLGKDTMGFAVMVTLLSLGLLTYLERSAHEIHNYRRTRKVLQELDLLIMNATIPSQDTIDNFRKKSNSASTVAEREAYADLVVVASDLTKLCEYAVSQAQWKVTKRVEEQNRANKAAEAQQDQADKAAKAQAAKQELRIKLQEALNAAAAPLPVSKTIDFSMACNEVVIEPTIAGQKWQVLYEFGEQLRHCLGEDASIPPLLHAVTGTHPIAETTFRMELDGHERDGHFEALCFRGGVKGQLPDGLTFESSLDGLIAAFYLRAALPAQLAWNHGRYGRNQEFIFSQKQAVAILEHERVPSDSEGLQAVKAPAGLRYSRAEDGTLTLRCLTYRPGEGFYDFAVSIVGGHASPVFETILYKWGGGIYY
ncbi:MAG: hypothetical protein Q8K74_00275 [Candidatus Nitrotoga sp.]|nr:hypothetical protein [Candidatus Nitrotoga sp.]MDP1854478.1 hypothetical protein [Candidatus Nitrotoga sp.]